MDTIAGFPKSGKAVSGASQNTTRSPRILLSRIYPAAIALLLFVVGCAFTFRISFLQHVANVDRLRDQVTMKIDYIHNNLSRELYANINLTQGLIDLVHIQGGIQQAQFNALARELMGHSGLIRNIALAPDNVIRCIYPLQGNEKALGLDYLKIPDQADLSSARQ
jgi:sensor domain CHASE-containing protein